MGGSISVNPIKTSDERVTIYELQESVDKKKKNPDSVMVSSDQDGSMVTLLLNTVLNGRISSEKMMRIPGVQITNISSCKKTEVEERDVNSLNPKKVPGLYCTVEGTGSLPNPGVSFLDSSGSPISQTLSAIIFTIPDGDLILEIDAAGQKLLIN